MSLEEKFNITIDDRDAQRFVTIGDTIAFIKGKVRWWREAIRSAAGNNNERSGRTACGSGQAGAPWRPTDLPMLELIDERPDPIFGVLGMTCQTLKCDFLECGKLITVWAGRQLVIPLALANWDNTYERYVIR
jgi:hypothetical protein